MARDESATGNSLPAMNVHQHRSQQVFGKKAIAALKIATLGTLQGVGAPGCLLLRAHATGAWR
jgi:hypothetical protein